MGSVLVDSISTRNIGFKGSQAKYSLNTPVQNASYEEIASVIKDASKDSFIKEKLNLPSGKDIARNFPGAFKSNHALNENGIKAFNGVFSNYNIDVSSSLKDFKKIMTSLFDAHVAPDWSDFALKVPNILRKL